MVGLLKLITLFPTIVLQWVKCFAIFGLWEIQFSSFKYFCWSHEGGKPHWKVRCQAYLIPSECYSPDLPQWFEHCLRIYGFRSIWHCQINNCCSFNLNKTSWTICLLYCNQLYLYLSHNKNFWFLMKYHCPILSISSQIRLWCMFICAAVKSHMKWNNVECVNTPTIMILPTTAGT